MYSRFLFNQPIFPELVEVRPVPKSKLSGIVVAELLQAGCPSCCPTNSVKALKDDIAPDRGQHVAIMLPRYVRNAVMIA